jgi:hypothetical protein
MDCDLGLHEGVQVAGTVDYTVDLDRPAANNVEDNVGVHDEHAVTVSPEFQTPGHASQMGLAFQAGDALIQAIEKCHGS